MCMRLMEPMTMQKIQEFIAPCDKRVDPEALHLISVRTMSFQNEFSCFQRCRCYQITAKKVPVFGIH